MRNTLQSYPIEILKLGGLMTTVCYYITVIIIFTISCNMYNAEGNPSPWNFSNLEEAQKLKFHGSWEKH